MIQIPESFFSSEKRLDFEISETMKKAWAIQLTVLDKILEVAEHNHIKVWLDYGSLLGAVRHKGYIPWDDDIDICLMRKDYVIFLMALKRELPEYFRVYSIYTTPSYNQPKAFVANRAHVDKGNDLKEKEITDIFFGLPYVAGVDVYPLDYVPSDPDQANLIRNIYIAVYDLAFSYDQYKESGELESYISQIEELLAVSIPRDDSAKEALWKLADGVATMTKKKESDSILWYPDMAMRTTDMRRPLEAYSETIITDFEMLKVPIPKGYHDVLLAGYYEDYMTPIQQPPAHEYPFYKEQQDWIDRCKKLS